MATSPGTIDIVSEFLVKPEAVPRFVELYGPEGAWAALFRRHPGFGGTRLLQDTDSSGRFLTIDTWESEARFADMRWDAAEEYARIDAACDDLTLSERKIGVFRTPR